jgi:hypothetical protein
VLFAGFNGVGELAQLRTTTVLQWVGERSRVAREGGGGGEMEEGLLRWATRGKKGTNPRGAAVGRRRSGGNE